MKGVEPNPARIETLTKEVTMTTASITATQMPAAKVREINQEIAAKSGLAYVPIVGRTFTIRKVLWVMGGDYNKATKTYEVPAHKAEEAQALASRVNATIEASMAEAQAKREAKAAAAK